MALSDLSFKLFTDSGLTVPFGGTLQLVENTDLSDNPQDFHLYFGSPTSTVQLEATSNPGVDNITLTPTDTLEDWTAATPYASGDLVEPTTPNTFVYKCTTAGTSHASVEPTWPTVGIGSTVSDGTAVWTFMGLRHDVTEVTLALLEADLDTNTPGAALSLGPTILGGTGDLVDVWVRIENAVTQVRNNVGHAEIGVFINEVIESDQP